MLAEYQRIILNAEEGRIKYSVVGSSMESIMFEVDKMFRIVLGLFGIVTTIGFFVIPFII